MWIWMPAPGGQERNVDDGLFGGRVEVAGAGEREWSRSGAFLGVERVWDEVVQARCDNRLGPQDQRSRGRREVDVGVGFVEMYVVYLMLSCSAPRVGGLAPLAIFVEGLLYLQFYGRSWSFYVWDASSSLRCSRSQASRSVCRCWSLVSASRHLLPGLACSVIPTGWLDPCAASRKKLRHRRRQYSD